MNIEKSRSIEILKDTVFVKNLKWSLLIRIVGLGLSFLSVPISLSYLGSDTYGIWITISSILIWINYFDFGVSNSLQNQLALAISQQRIEDAKNLVNTSYSITLKYIVPTILLITCTLSYFIDWNNILHTKQSQLESIRLSIVILGGSTVLQLVLKLINAIFFAFQRTRLNELVIFFIQLITVLQIFFFKSINYQIISPFLTIILINAVVPVLIWGATSIYMYANEFSILKPSIKNIKWSEAKNLLQLGLSFTVLQLYGIVLFFTDNLLISYLFGSAEVTDYNLIVKYYSVLTLAFSMLLTPYWSAISQAYGKNDNLKISSLMKFVGGIFVGFVLIGIIMLRSEEFLIKIWTNIELTNVFTLALLIMVSTLLAMFNNIFTIYLNAAAKFKLQIVTAMIIIILNPLLSVIMVKELKFGIESIPLINLFCLILYGSIAMVQAHKIFYKTETGIWSK